LNVGLEYVWQLRLPLENKQIINSKQPAIDVVKIFPAPNPVVAKLRGGNERILEDGRRVSASGHPPTSRMKVALAQPNSFLGRGPPTRIFPFLTIKNIIIRFSPMSTFFEFKGILQHFFFPLKERALFLTVLDSRRTIMLWGGGSRKRKC